MRILKQTKNAEQVFPLLGVFGPVAISRKGVLTIGWELTLPVEYTVAEKEYDDILANFSRAIAVLPSWSIVHRQDLYTYDEYGADDRPGFLHRSQEDHFSGRRHLRHRCYIFISIAERYHTDKAGKLSGLFGIRADIKVPSKEGLETFINKGKEFMAILTTGGMVEARRLTEADWNGDGTSVGIVQRYMMLGNDSPIISDIGLSPDSVRVYDNVAQAFAIGESDVLPSEVNSVSRVAELSSTMNTVNLSYGARLGVLLDCEHVVNSIVLIPSQQEILRSLDKERKKMTSGLSSSDNRINAEEIQVFLDEAYSNALFTVKAHTNVIAWSTPEKKAEVTGLISASLAAMNVNATYNLHNTPILYWAGIPGNAFEIGKENLMTMEMQSYLALGSYETFDRGIPGGFMKICDRSRHIPIAFDTQLAARNAGYIFNYNMFILGGSGSGKSFFTNFYVQNCYDAGESVFIIDVGDSYEGLCAVIHEESGGKDGAYLSWDKDHPFSFNPFIGIDEWISPTGGLNTDDNGVNFFMSFLQTAWAPDGGWTSDMKTVLTQFVVDFIRYKNAHELTDLVFDHFFRFLDEEISPKIRYVPKKRKKKTEEGEEEDVISEKEKAKCYYIGTVRVSTDLLDIDRFLLSLKNYSLTGSYSFLLNDPHPKDLFTSRFTVFEVDKLSQDDSKFYSLCILCIMNAFERKMRGTMGFKNMIIEEAWKAISNETMAPYLAGLWKTARKFNTSATVVTQEVEDILSSAIIKTAIIDNSAVKILLDQSNHLNTFDKIQAVLSLSDKDRNLVLSLNRAPDNRYKYREVFINLGGKFSFVAATEVSPQQAIAFESAKDKKEPFLKLAKELGSYIEAIKILTGKTDKTENV